MKKLAVCIALTAFAVNTMLCGCSLAPDMNVRGKRAAVAEEQL